MKLYRDYNVKRIYGRVWLGKSLNHYLLLVRYMQIIVIALSSKEPKGRCW